MSQAKTFCSSKRDSTTLDQTGRHWSPAPLIASVYTQFSFSVILWFWNKIRNINSAETECGNYLRGCKTKQQQQTQQQQQPITDSLSPNTGAPWVNIPSKPGPRPLYWILSRFHEPSADAARYTRYCIWAADGAVRLLRPQIVKVTERHVYPSPPVVQWMRLLRPHIQMSIWCQRKTFEMETPYFA